MTKPALCLCLALAVVAATGCAESQTQGPAVQIPKLPLSEGMDKPVRNQFSVRHTHLLAALNRTDSDPVDVAWSLGQLGRIFHAYHFLEEAITCYEQAHGLDPLTFEWPYLLGHLQKVLGRTDAATQSFSAASRLRPQESGPYTAMGEIALEAGRSEEAEQLLNQALEADPRNALIQYRIARVEIAEGRLPDAIERLRAQLLQQPRAYQLLYAMGDALKLLGREEEAGSFLAQIPDTPNRIGLKSADPWMEAVQNLAISATALERKARKALVLGQWRRAQELLQQAAEIAPDRVEISYNLALAQFRSGSIERAARTLSRLTERFPDFGPAYRLKGQMARQRGELIDALDWFRKAVEVNPRNAQSLLALADHWLVIGDYAAAGQKYSDTILLDQRNVDAHVGLSIVQFSTDNRIEAIAVLQHALGQMPYEHRLNWWIKRWSLAGGDAAGASELGVPRGAFEIETLAMGLAAGGDFSSAARWQERAMRMVGKDHVHQATMRARLARYQENQQVTSYWVDSDIALRFGHAAPGSPTQLSDEPEAPSSSGRG